jgi:hypothetical protein
MNRRLVVLLGALFVLGFLAITPVQSQQHRATRLGNPATRFADPLQTREDLRRMFTSEALRADVDFIARASDYRGDLDDLRRAATNTSILELRIPTKTLLPAMSSRKDGKPVLLHDVLWAGQGPIDAYEFYFASRGRRYRVVTPKACANFWVEDYGKELLPVLTMECSAPAEVLLRRPTQVCLTVSNTGDSAEPATTVTLVVPGGAEFVSATGPGQAGEGRVVWEIANLLPGGSSNLCASFNSPQPATLPFAATARGRISTPVESRCETRVVGIPAILIEVVDLDDPIEVGRNETYEIQVVNQGSAVLTNVKVFCALEEGQEFVSGSGPSGVQAEGRTVTLATLPELNPKDKAVWQVVVKVLKAGDVRFAAEVSADQFKRPIKETESTQQY